MDIDRVGKVLHDKSRPLKERFRALFTLRSIGGKSSLEWMQKTIKEDSSELLKHEIAYVMGQMQDAEAIEGLISILSDPKMEPIVRHEAAEALGALGEDPKIRKALESILNSKDLPIEVTETVSLALSRLDWLKNPEKNLSKNPYDSVDPAPPFPLDFSSNLESLLHNESEDIFIRYRAMFSLRNKGDTDSIQSLCRGLIHDKSSALFRHEVAYVLGQIQSFESKKSLIQILQNEKEHPMVRHECAEALGSIGTPEIHSELQKYLGKEVPAVVRESCEIALDFCDYNQSSDFQYANTLSSSIKS
ncbi:deoxyhypusine hydroxylase [Lepeophtheirus salmonis]|uniref:Deoxyhypusine hydroxylase n=1 Tax=Lepeophtheirus salmonis TaxID=72036 RepID=C1BVM4_LEPSM|nr:deoxyhypusine hydroxylase-like [Lepeophtheirus salmonis]ACO13077.1 Deoxyhypusine hydroxylase [Lepeophtheirus salmonis]